jgi:hypothetical protein
MVVIHNIKLPKESCDLIVGMLKHLTTSQSLSSTNLINVNVTKPEGYTPCCITDNREIDVWKTWKSAKEIDQIIYKSTEINKLIPDSIFEYFNIVQDTCQIDVRRFFPAKMHVPHKDYYFNLSNPKWDIPPKDTTELHSRLSEMKTTPTDVLMPKNIIRLWISLTEPKFGHILIIEDTALYFLEQGSIVTWPADKLHTAANLGYEDRYIMRLTGYLKE